MRMRENPVAVFKDLSDRTAQVTRRNGIFLSFINLPQLYEHLPIEIFSSPAYSFL